jgi:hypothetical protein
MKITLQLTQLLNILRKEVVGETGIEPATSWSRRKLLNFLESRETLDNKGFDEIRT